MRTILKLALSVVVLGFAAGQARAQCPLCNPNLFNAPPGFVFYTTICNPNIPPYSGGALQVSPINAVRGQPLTVTGTLVYARPAALTPGVPVYARLVVRNQANAQSYFYTATVNFICQRVYRPPSFGVTELDAQDFSITVTVPAGMPTGWSYAWIEYFNVVQGQLLYNAAATGGTQPLGTPVYYTANTAFQIYVQ